MIKSPFFNFNFEEVVNDCLGSALAWARKARTPIVLGSRGNGIMLSDILDNVPMNKIIFEYLQCTFDFQAGYESSIDSVADFCNANPLYVSELKIIVMQGIVPVGLITGPNRQLKRVGKPNIANAFFAIFLKPNSVRNHTLGDVIRAGRSFSGVKRGVIFALDTAKALKLNDDFRDALNEVNSALNKSSSEVKRSRKFRYLKFVDQQFCSLCWRLIPTYKQVNAGKRGGQFCHIHDQYKSQAGYSYMRRRVVNHAERRLTKEDEQLLNRMKRGGKFAGNSPLYQLLHSCCKKPNDLEGLNEELDELTAMKRINLLVAKNYPEAWSKILLHVENNVTTWKEYFMLIIESLDSTAAGDTLTWLNAPNDFDGPGSLQTGWMALITVIHRYEAVQNVENSSRPRGPEKGQVYNKNIREEIRDMLNSQKKLGGRVNYAEIARQLGVKRQYVSQLVKKMK